MPADKLTTKENWKSHWTDREIKYVKQDFSFSEIFKEISLELDEGSSCVELGGFPGYFSIFSLKYLKLKPTLIDFFFDHKYFQQVIRKNNLQAADVSVIEADIFEHQPVTKYDFVFSIGLIEHFTDLKSIINVHKKYLSHNGKLLLIVPNFLGVNGIIQRIFDKPNLDLHNLNAMDINKIISLLDEAGFWVTKSGYYPSTQIWIENIQQRNILLRIFMRAANHMMSLAGKLFGRKNRLLSNSIYWTARLK